MNTPLQDRISTASRASKSSQRVSDHRYRQFKSRHGKRENNSTPNSPYLPESYKPLPPLPLYARRSDPSYSSVHFPEHQTPNYEAITNPYHCKTPEEHRAHYALMLAFQKTLSPISNAAAAVAAPTHPTPLASPSQDRAPVQEPSAPLTQQERHILILLLSTCRRPGNLAACFRDVLAPKKAFLLVASEDAETIRKVQGLLEGLNEEERKEVLRNLSGLFASERGRKRRYILEVLAGEGGRGIEVVGRRAGVEEAKL